MIYFGDTVFQPHPQNRQRQIMIHALTRLYMKADLHDTQTKRELKRLLFTLLAISAWFALVSPVWESPQWELAIRLLATGLFALLAFGLFERSPARLPRGVARWVLQVVGVALAIPIATFVIYVVSTEWGEPAFWQVRDRLGGFGILTVSGVLFAPWIAMAALIRQRDSTVRSQALAVEQLERKAADARLRLLQAQVEPHFLFNTLANVRELVQSQSAQAAPVLDSLIAYLRAAVPRLHEPVATLSGELDLVRAYLELMHMRMPDRLQFSIDVDSETMALRCPPMTLLTLVENAVRHGIDPSEIGGRIDIQVRRRDRHCIATVSDTGIGLQPFSNGLGTGLATLQERLQLAFGEKITLRLSEVQPHGVCAELNFPAVPRNL